MLDSISDRRKRTTKALIIALLCVLFLFVHLWKLGSLMDVWNCDELGLVNNAVAIRDHGTDRYGNAFPVYLRNYCGGQSALYTYSFLPFLHLFGTGRLSVRLVIFCYSVISAIYWIKTFCYLKKDAYRNTLMILAIMSLCPVYVFLSRIALDCNLMLTVAPVFLYYLIKAIDTGKTRYFVLSSLSCVLILYSYVLSHLIVPIFVVAVFALLLKNKKVSVKNTVLFFAIIVALAWPLILFQIVDAFGLDTVKIGPMTISKLVNRRRDEINPLMMLTNLICCVIPVFGCDGLHFNSIVYFGNFYWVLTPFVISGLVISTRKAVKNIKNSKLTFNELQVIWFFSIWLAYSIVSVNVYRANPVFVSTAYFLIVGLVEAFHFFKSKKHFKPLLGMFTFLVAVSAGSFMWFYFGGEYSRNYQLCDGTGYDMTEALARVDEIREEYGNRDLYICYVRCTEEYYLYAKNIDSQDFYFEGDRLRSYDEIETNYQNNYFVLSNDYTDGSIFMLDELRDETKNWREALIADGYDCEYVGHYYVLYKA